MGNNSKGVLGVLSHPLFLLILGSIIGSFLIPSIGNEINEKRVIREARLRKAVDIISNNTKTVSQLNGMVVRLGSFHDNNIKRKPSTVKLKELQEKLSEDMDNSWLEFDKTAWWWCEDLNSEAVILGIIPVPGAAKLRTDVDAYKDNILKTSNVMKELWTPCISADYNYTDGRVDKIKEQMNKELIDLFNVRNQLISNLISDFTQPK